VPCEPPEHSSDKGILQTPNRPAGTECVLAGTYLERPMSLPVELCEHIAQDCLQAAKQTKDPETRELLLTHAVHWIQDALAALKESRTARRRRAS
jgi:hypothetical protein